jgi:cytosine/adenosine deaminase-related metal-dependent hydrolase
MRESGDLARRHGVTRHTHVAEVIEEERYCLETLGVRPLRRLEDLGWLAPDVWLAHVVHVEPDEIAALAGASVGVAHCPTSNMRLASGAAPVLDMLEAGVAVGLGVDGSASNDTGDLLAEARHALLLSRVREQTRLIGTRKVLEMATRNGAHALHRDDIGSLEAGKQADVAMFALDGVAGAGFEHDPVAGLVLGSPGRVVHLLVQGRPVVENRSLVGASEEEIRRDHARTVARIVR